MSRKSPHDFAAELCADVTTSAHLDKWTMAFAGAMAQAAKDERERTMFVLSAARTVLSDWNADRSVSGGMTALSLALRGFDLDREDG